MFVLAWQVRDTGALLSPSHGTGEYQPRGEHDCWGGVLLGEKKLAVSTALLATWPPRNTNKKRFFVFEPAFLLRTPRRHKPRKPQYLRTVSTAQHPSIGPAQSSKVHTSIQFFMFLFFLFLWFFVDTHGQQQLFLIFFLLTLSPVTGRRLDYTIFSVDIGVTD